MGDEWENNALHPRCGAGWTTRATEKCTVWDEPATLVLWGDDYDGGHKAWVRWDESGEDDIVPGCQVVRRRRARHARRRARLRVLLEASAAQPYWPQTGHWPGPDCS